ncbi:beta-phosphoglucomutase-like phosphatase (HAD superfamily) [Bifidobacterium commune]|nr:beta-phosphoglucomutase-like phosphatase (HAD superfamily) [Bifidobacterium commune]
MKEREVKLSLASASMNGPFILEKPDLSDAFDAIADPSKVAEGKPAPDIFLAVASAIGLDAGDCVGIENSVAGITALMPLERFRVGVSSPDELGQAGCWCQALRSFDSMASNKLGNVAEPRIKPRNRLAAPSMLKFR